MTLAPLHVTSRITPSRITAVFFSVAVFAPVLWMAMDREPPFVRASGEITAEEPSKCGLSSDAPRTLSPGGCAQVSWKILPLKNCSPVSEFNVTRTLVDSRGDRHSLPSTRSHYKEASPRGETSELTRYFVIPLNMPVGRTTYDSDACFACNPVQKLLPVCVTRPDIQFDIVVVQKTPK